MKIKIIKSLKLNNRSIKCIENYIQYKKIAYSIKANESYSSLKKNFISKIFYYIIKTKLDLTNSKSFGGGSVPFFFNINLQTFVIFLILFFELIFFSKKKRYVKKTTYIFNNFSHFLYNYFQKKKIKLYIGTLHDLCDCPELILSVLQNGGKFYAIQMGSGYNIFKNNHLDNFEIKATDNFFNWFFGKNNLIIQNRYSILNNYSSLFYFFLKKNKINFILTKKLNNIYYRHCGLKKKTFNSIVKEFNLQAYFFPHPRGNINYNLNLIPKDRLLYKPHYKCSHKSLNILDDLDHTIIFYFLHFEIPFLIITEKNKFKKKNLTTEGCDVVKFLRLYKILYFADEINYFKKIVDNFDLEQLKVNLIMFKKKTNIYKVKQNIYKIHTS